MSQHHVPVHWPPLRTTLQPEGLQDVSVGLMEGRIANLSNMRLTYLIMIFTIQVLLLLSPVSYPKPN
jgi:hypothetical protein